MLFLSAERRLLSTLNLRHNTALACGDRAAVRASARMAQEGTDALRCFRRENMLELAGFFRDLFFVVHMKGLGKEPFREAMTADHVFSTLAALFREDDHVIAVAGVLAGGTKRYMAAIEHLLVRMRLQGVLCKIDQPHALHPLQREPHWQRAFNFNPA